MVVGPNLADGTVYDTLEGLLDTTSVVEVGVKPFIL